MTVCIDAATAVQSHQSDTCEQQPVSVEDPVQLLDQGARSLFRQLQWQVLHEAKTGGPPRLLCMLAYLAKMSAKEREKVMEFHHSRNAKSPPASPPRSSPLPVTPPSSVDSTLTGSPPPPLSSPPGIPFPVYPLEEPAAPQAPSPDEAIAGLVRSCHEGTPQSCTGSAHALGQLASLSMESREAIGHAGGVVALLRLVCTPFPEAQAQAIGALLSLVEGSVDNQTTLVRSGGIVILVNVANAPNTPMDLSANIAWTFGLVVRSNKVHARAVIEAGALPMLLRLSSEVNSSACSLAVFALRHLAQCSAETQLAVARAGAIAPLVRVLQEAAPDAQGYAAGALATLADSCTENQVRIVAAGGIAALAALLEGSDADACRRAASALANIANHSEDHRVMIARAGCIPHLIRLAGEGIADGQGNGDAAYTLMCIAFRSLDNQAAIVRAGGVATLVQLLRQGRGPTVRGYAAGALGSLAEGNPDARAAIVQAGGIIALAALAREGGSPKACKYAVGALRHFVAPSATGQSKAV